MNTQRKETGLLHGMFNNITSGKYNTQIIIGVVAAIGLSFGLAGYHWYTKRYEQAAFQLFAQQLEEFERMEQHAKKEDWVSVAFLFETGYTQYKKSVLAPLFLAYQAQALLKQNNVEQATVIMEKAVNSMSSGSPVYTLYKTKLALMKLDAADKATQEHGVSLLTELSSNSANKDADMAAYYLGLYYWDAKDAHKAKEVWQKLADSMKDVVKGASPWAHQAQTKLAQIS